MIHEHAIVPVRGDDDLQRRALSNGIGATQGRVFLCQTQPGSWSRLAHLSRVGANNGDLGLLVLDPNVS